MKTIIIILLLTLGLFLSPIPQSAYAAPTSIPLDQRFIFTPWMKSEPRKQVKKQFRRYLVNAAPVGTKITVVDGYAMNVITEFTIPALKYDSPLARETSLDKHLSKISRWFKREVDKSHPLYGKNVVRIPEVLDHISSGVGENTRIIYWASPLYYSLETPQFNFARGGGYTVPNLQNLKLRPERYPFGALGKTSLNQSAVFFIYQDDSIFPELRFKRKLERFYDSYFKAIKARGVYGFTSDYGEVLKAICKPLVERDIINEVDVSVPFEDGGEIVEPHLHDMGANYQERFEQSSGESAAAALWDDQADIDIYWISPDGDVVSYHNKTHPQAHYLEDKRNGSLGWEQINFASGQALRPGCELWLNLYRTAERRGHKHRGLYFIRAGDRTIKSEYVFPARAHGDKAKGYARRHQDDPNWLKIDWSTLITSSH